MSEGLRWALPAGRADPSSSSCALRVVAIEEGKMSTNRSMAQRSTLLTVPIVITCLSSLPATAQAQLDDRVDGTFVYAGGEVQSAAHAMSLERAAEELNPLIRPIGLRALRRHLKIARFVSFKSSGDHLTITLDPFPARRSKLDGTASTFLAINGKNSSIRRVVRGRTVIETLASDRVRRVISYGFDESFDRVTLAWNVSLPRYFKAPIRFRLSYRRQR